MTEATVRAAAQEAVRQLEACGVPDAEYDAWELLAFALREDRLLLRLAPERMLTGEEAERYRPLIRRRAAREPLQYIEGATEFMGLPIVVSPDVLIPRQDTEILCEEALRRVPRGGRVLEIGAGSGALSIALAKLGGYRVTAVDISPKALAVARRNAASTDAEIEWIESDCFAALKGRVFDAIVSNPPYISKEEMRELMPEVRQEPALALFGGADGLDLYRRITSEAGAHLAPGGWLLFEIGWRQKDAVSALLREWIGEPFAARDLGGNWRVVGAQKL